MTSQKYGNEVRIAGFLKYPFVYSKTEGNSRIFSSILIATRPSGRHDEVPVSVEESVLDSISLSETTGRILVKGNVVGRTLNHKLTISVRIERIIPEYKRKIRNNVRLCGEIASEIAIQSIPNGNFYCNFILVTSINGLKKEYIPVIAWNKTALWIKEYGIGHKIEFNARFQSRRYKKFFEDGSFEEKETHELVIMRLNTSEMTED